MHVTACSLVEGKEWRHVSSKCLCVSAKLHSVSNAVVIRDVCGVARPCLRNVTAIVPNSVRVAWVIAV
jgi:hypothetical protein